MWRKKNKEVIYCFGQSLKGSVVFANGFTFACSWLLFAIALTIFNGLLWVLLILSRAIFVWINFYYGWSDMLQENNNKVVI